MFAGDKNFFFSNDEIDIFFSTVSKELEKYNSVVHENGSFLINFL